MKIQNSIAATTDPNTLAGRLKTNCAARLLPLVLLFTGPVMVQAQFNYTTNDDNMIAAYAADPFGFFSPTSNVSLDYVLNTVLTVRTNGHGTINPNYNGALLPVGQSYTMTAMASPGYVFTGWTGSSTTNGATLTFVMASNLTFTANFAVIVKPVVNITNLVANQTVSNAAFRVSGTASDNSGMATLWYQLNNGAWTLASSTNRWTNWWADLALMPGTNILRTDITSHGCVYVADWNNNLIRKITSVGMVTVVTTLAGDTYDLTNGYYNGGYADDTNGAAKFNNPFSVATDGSGNVYVADSGNNLIRKITPAGVVTTLAGDTYDLTNGYSNDGYADGTGSGAMFNNPSSVATDGSGNVYVADSKNNLIRMISPAGVVTTLAGDTYDLTNGYPNGGYADGANDAARFNGPSGVATDNSGNVYVADWNNNLIRKISPAGVVTTLAGDTYDLTNGYPNGGYADGTNDAARFNGTSDVATDGSGNVYVADWNNNLIRKITPAGVVTTLAGDTYDLTNGYPNDGYADGANGAARFNGPSGVALDGSGNVYVADWNNNLIRKITPAGVVTTPDGDTYDLTNGYYNSNNNLGYADGTGGTARFYNPSGITLDNNGVNFSGTNQVSFIYVVSTPLTVNTNGRGSLNPNYNGAFLQIGRSYSINATPGTGFAFVNWTGGTNLPLNVLTNGPTVQFLMASNLTLQANFVDTNKPTMSITNLVANQTVSNAGFRVSGTAGDNYGVATVWYQLNNGAWMPASSTNGWTNWWANLNLQPGTNILRTYAVDIAGHNYVYVADQDNCLIRKITPAGVVTTLAGDTYDQTNGNSYWGYADGTNSAAKFTWPYGVATDGSGNVYVADLGNNLIRKITPAGVVTTLAGDTYDLTNGYSYWGYADGTNSAARFNGPIGVAADGSGNVYVADTYNDLIRKITPAGVVTTLAGDTYDLTNGYSYWGYADGTNGAASFNGPIGVAADGSGNVYVADSKNNLIRKITPAGVVTTLAGDTNDLTNGHSNDGYADDANGAAMFNGPSGVAMDGSGNVYVADSGNNLIRKITPVGVVTTLAGDTNDLINGYSNYGYADGANGAAMFNNPFAVATDGSGNVYVADSGNNLIRKITPVGVVTTLAGDTNDLINGNPNYGYADGTGGASMFYTPSGVALDNSGANLSGTNQVSFIYVVSATLTVSTNGPGSLSPNYNGALLQIGKSYSMTATAAAGFAFVNWTGSITTNGATLQFTMASNLTFTANFVDVTRPTNTITAPASGQRVSNAVFTVTGTARDNVAVSNVWYQLNGGGWTNASSANGWTNWTAAVNLIPGTNTVAAYAMDTSGNVSTTNSVSFQFVATNQLQIRASGLGTISPNYSNAWLEIGRNYSITSTPASGFTFANWVLSTNWIGGATTTKTNLQFMMASNLTLQVNFLDVTKPTNTITAPTAGQHMTNALATVVGTARDNWKVAGVWYQFNNGAWNPTATTNGWTNWTTTLQLIAGTNTVKAYAMDLGGNFSMTNSLSVVSSNTFKLQLAFTNALPLKTNGLVFTLQLSTGLNGHIQVSTNLTGWTTLTNFVGTNSMITFRDPAATNSNHRFYRAVIP